MKHTVLIIEDDYSIADAISFMLKNEGYNALAASRGETGLELLAINPVDLVLLDVSLPDISGFEVLKKINSQTIPVIMLTARGDITDKVLGLELGADDYITKPFDIRELLARIKVALRRSKSSKQDNADVIHLSNGISIDVQARRVEKDGEPLQFKPKEYDLLLFLAQNRNIVFDRSTLLDRVWGMDYQGEDRTVDVHIRRLRSKLNDANGEIIETVFGVGYRMNQ